MINTTEGHKDRRKGGGTFLIRTDREGLTKVVMFQPRSEGGEGESVRRLGGEYSRGKDSPGSGPKALFSFSINRCQLKLFHGPIFQETQIKVLLANLCAMLKGVDSEI